MPDIVLKDRDGNDVTHEGAIGVKMQNADGSMQKFLPGEAEEKTVELDFSAGDMEVLPSDGKLLTKVDIPTPDNLKPENIVKDVEIAGIVGTHEGGGGRLVPAIFTAVAAYGYGYYSTSTYFSGGTPWVSVPLIADIIGYRCGADGAYASKSGACAYIRSTSNTNMDATPGPNITISETETAKTITYTQSDVYTGGSTYYYKATCTMLMVYFTMPGIYMYADDNGGISIYADATATEYPSHDAGIPVINCIDLTESVIQKVPVNMVYHISCKTIKFPSTLAEIGSYSLNSPDFELLDFSLCKSVPTLGGAYISKLSDVLKINVPAALYDEWIAATNWSEYADYIVAV